MEMLFSIAILLVGMVGIASVLSLAGRNAIRSRTLTESQIFANNAMNTFLSHQMNSKDRWDPSPGEVANQYTGVCIDPLYIGNDEWFGPRSLQSGNLGMRRVGVKSSDFSSYRTRPKMFEKLFTSSDDISMDEGADTTVPVTRLFESLPSGANAKASRQQLYSWFATIPWVGNEAPNGPANNMCNGLLISIVVVKNRVRDQAPFTVNILPASGNSNFDSEIGGALRVIVDGLSSGDTLRTGDWIMLSRRVGREPFDSWYRVVSISNDSEVSGGAYKATLAGRELPKNTVNLTGTIVPGVVFVSERVVPIVP